MAPTYDESNSQSTDENTEKEWPPGSISPVGGPKKGINKEINKKT